MLLSFIWPLIFYAVNCFNRHSHIFRQVFLIFLKPSFLSYAVGTKLGPPRWPLLEVPLYFFKIVPVIKNSEVQYGFYWLIIHLKRFNLFNLVHRVSFKGEKLLSFSFFSWKERNPGDEGVIYPHKFFLSTHSILKKQS